MTTAAIVSKTSFFILRGPLFDLFFWRCMQHGGLANCLAPDHRLRAAPGVDVTRRHIGRRHVDPDRPAAARDHAAHRTDREDASGLRAQLQPGHVYPGAEERVALESH